MKIILFHFLRVIPFVIACIITMLISIRVNCQDSTSQSHFAADQMSDRFFNSLTKKYNSIGDDIKKKTVKLLMRLQKKEQKMKSRLSKEDSLKAAQLFNGTEAKYQQLQNNIQNPASTISSAANPLREYIPGLDSMQTALKFLQQNSSNLSPGGLQQLQSLNADMRLLQGNMQSSTDIQAYLKQREQLLEQELQQFGFTREIQSIKKEIYYYQQQMTAYKNMLNDPVKMERLVLTELNTVPAFQTFMQKNSYLSSLFAIPPDYSDTSVSLAGLQTRAQVQQLITQQLGSMPAVSGGNAAGSATQMLQQGLQQAQQQSSTLQNSVNQFANGGNSSMIMPDFKTNSQKTKTFLKRIKLGWNMQSVAGIAPNPNTCVFGLQAGYKLSDTKEFGVGASYIMGTGYGIQDIQITNQGVGIRSYLDVKAKKSLWITGGFEYNYMQAFARYSGIPGFQFWQKSALLGVTKKYKLAKKEGNFQLLYDFLAEQEIPKGRSLIFRMGYSF
jgi:hypothetical protein